MARGRITAGPRVRAVLESTDLVIAADGGVAHCLSLDVTPDLVVGDLDSTPPEALTEIHARGWELHTHPIEENATDGELALREALARGS